MVEFKEINGQLCIMLEKPVPLTPDAQFPCVVRLIQDDSPMGRYNKWNWEGLTELTHIRELIGLPDDTIPCEDDDFTEHISHYEIIGYPVADGSAEWALYRMMQGDMVCQRDSHFKRYYKNGNVRWLDRAGIERSLTTELFLKNFADTSGWQLYEPKQGPVKCEYCRGRGSYISSSATNPGYVRCPACNGTGKVEKPRFEVRDWVEVSGRKHGQLVKYPALGYPATSGVWDFVDTKTGNVYCVEEKDITRKLSPSDVKVKITLEGTVRSSINDCCFELSTPGGGWATIGYNEIDPATRSLVESLLKAQEKGE